VDNKLKCRFLKDLSKTLNLDETLKHLNMQSSDASNILLEAKDFFEINNDSKNSSSLLVLYVDGASRGNPGEAGAGVLIKNENGDVIKRATLYLGITTNNVAEYRALIHALEMAKQIGCNRVRVFSDSQLMVRQINGKYAVRSEDLKPLFHEVMSLLKGLKNHDIIHIVRAENKEADKLANRAIDERY